MDRSRDRYGGDMLTRSQSVDSDDFGETIARVGSLRRLRDLYWSGGAQLSSRRVEAH
jgi:hypothetical protein